MKQASQDSPLIITGTVTGLPKGLHGLHVHESKLKGTDCSTAGAHFNPENVRFVRIQGVLFPIEIFEKGLRESKE